ncbi:MAG TPA: hypothetical protein VJ957_08005, partial [Longimicrobiales bacterium]|nr:hypothetical protein [Longimicrobiales bacterium]
SLGAMDRIQRQLERHGIRMIVVVTEPRSPDLQRALARLDVPFPVYTDVKGQATAEFVPPGTPTYYVLDGAGRVRFAYSDPDRVVEQAVLLQHASSTLAAAD